MTRQLVLARSIGAVVLPALILLVAPARTVAAAPPTGAITVRVTSLRSSAGQVGCSLYGSAKGFPKDPAAAVALRFCPIEAGASVCVFPPVPAGTYAVACFHDENRNGKLDTGIFGIPKEGVCASNGATGTMGPPSFEDARFASTGAPRDVPVAMRY